MNELINWVARNNTLMIQISFTIVLLLVVIYIFRLFFVSSETPLSTSGSGEVSQLNQKIDQLLQQKNEASTAVGNFVDSTSASSPELERLRSEVVTLRTTLNESEKKVFDLSPSANVPQTNEANSLVENNVGTEKVTELTAKLEQLEARLAEYDIIAEDIAELSQLRTENSDLKKRLGLPDENALTSDFAPAVSIYEETISSAPSRIEAETALLEEDLVKSTSAATSSAAAALGEPFIAELNSDISEADKNVLDDFEKLMKKGSS
ncbi:MAG: hypothetical protein H7328_04905 [Bdellovibrio sp.]|nr:hypothetical protein [Bdellovibrio sp.]